MVIEFKKLDSLDLNFEKMFSAYEVDFYNILSKSYTTFYGRSYHKDRIEKGNAVIYLGFVDNILVAVSYVKRNLRRGGIAVFPVRYRRLGLAENLVRLSLEDFPRQFTILSTNLKHSNKMLSLMQKIGFNKAMSEKEIKNILSEECLLLNNFRHLNGYFVFDRLSVKRNSKRECLTLLHTF